MVQLLDHRHRPIDMRALEERRGGPSLTGVRSVIPQHPIRGLTPERMAAILREAETPGYGHATRYLELAEVMEERDLHYVGVLGTRKRAVSQIGIQIEPASDAARDAADADLVREFFDREAFEDEAFDLLDAIGKGFAVSEIIWERSARQWMPARLEMELPHWYGYDAETGASLMRRDEGGWTPLEPWKYVVHEVRAKSGLAIRGGLARIAAWAWLFKVYGMKDWVRFCEAYGQPIRIGRYPPNARQEDKDVLETAIRNVAVDAAALIPEGMGIEFISVEGAAARAEIYRDLIRYIDSKLSIAVIGQTLTTEQGESGARALGEVHNLVRGDIERADGKQLAATLRRDLVIPIVILNHGPRDAYPLVRIERAAAVDKDLLSRSLERLVPLGLRVRAEEVRGMLGLAHPDRDDEVLEPPAAGSTDPPSRPPAKARDAGGEPDHRALARELDAADPLPALTARTRAAVGPLVDGWIGRLAKDAADADSLTDLRARLDARLAASWRVEEVADTLASAFAAAELAGRYDVAEEAGETSEALARDADAWIALASASASHTRLPFEEQIAFFRGKLDLPTRSWTDLWEAEHDKAFVVAGAAQEDLVSDLRAAVDRGIADGQTLATFQRDFDAIVAKHGWSYVGGRDWRTRVIYGTNLRTSYAAGRYRQAKDIAERRPYWRYRHSDASERPRQNHLGWDGLILRHDDPWWNTHAPPNGWGCKCYFETLAERDLERLGKSGPDAAPPIVTREVTVGARGPNPRTVRVPEGIDPGWAYAPGQSALRPGGGPPKPPVAPPPRPAPGAWDPTTTAGEWHDASWNESPEWLRTAVGKAGVPTVNEVARGKKSFQTGQTIQIDRLKGSESGKAIWRHEFGHFLDMESGSLSPAPGPGRYRSGRDDFTKAMRADARALTKNGLAGSSRGEARAAADGIFGRASTDRRRRLRELADDAGVDLDEMEGWVERQAALGKEPAGSRRRDAGLARALVAWRRGDARELLDALERVERDNWGDLTPPSFAARKGAYEIGSEPMLSDLFDAATNKRIWGSAQHSATYYKHKGARQNETWANLVSVEGSGRFGARILTRFTPKAYKVFREALEETHGVQ